MRNGWFCLLAGAAAVLAAPADAALVTFALSGDYAATWKIDTDVLPDYSSDQGVSYYRIMGDFPGASTSGVDIDFFSDASSGGLRLTDNGGDNLILLQAGGEQLYAGDASAPMFRSGRFALSDGNGSYALTIAPQAGAVPEPASWATMILGFGLVGGALRRRSRLGMASWEHASA